MIKKYTPNEKEKYMCEKHKKYFKKKLVDWKNEIMESNAKGLYLNEIFFARIIFASCCLSMMISIIFFIREIQISTKALKLHISDMDVQFKE